MEKQKSRVEKYRKKQKKQILERIIVSVFFLSIIIFTTSLARYVFKEVKDIFLMSKNFYFNSDKLSASGMNFQIDNWNGVDSYPITYNMNSFKNNKVKAETDITYEITYTCSSNIICRMEEEDHIIYSSTNVDSFDIDVAPAVAMNDGDSATITVEASATSPYTKTIKGTITLKVGKVGLDYAIEDETGRPYLDVKITNAIDYYTVTSAFDSYGVGDKLTIDQYLELSDANKSKCKSATITLSWNPNTIILDQTSPAYLKKISTTTDVVDSLNYIDSISFNIEAVTSETVRFYKRVTSNNYTYPFESATSVVIVTYN